MEPRPLEDQPEFSNSDPKQDGGVPGTLDRSGSGPSVLPKDQDGIDDLESLAITDSHPSPNMELLGNVNLGSGVQFGNFSGNVFFHGDPDPVSGAREIFIESIRKRDNFMSTFLSQALRQASATFNLSVCFMVVGGAIVLAAAVLAVGGFAGSPSRGVALVSGIGGILISTSGAAFTRRADKARKHLAQQAEMMQSQLLDEQKFSQVVDLLTGIRDSELSDQARISLAMRLMGEINTSQKVGIQETPDVRLAHRKRKSETS